MSVLSQSSLKAMYLTCRGAYTDILASVGNEVQSPVLGVTMYQVWVIWDELTSHKPTKAGIAFYELAKSACESAIDAYKNRLGEDWKQYAQECYYQRLKSVAIS